MDVPQSPILQDFTPLSAALDAVSCSSPLLSMSTPLGSMKSLSLAELKKSATTTTSTSSEKEQDSIIDITSNEAASLFNFPIHPPENEDSNLNSNCPVTPVKPRRDDAMRLIKTPVFKFSVAKNSEMSLSDLPMVHSCKSELESLNDTDSDSDSVQEVNLCTSLSPVFLSESSELLSSKFRKTTRLVKRPSFYREAERSDDETAMTRPIGVSSNLSNKRRSPDPMHSLHRSRSFSSYGILTNTPKLLPHTSSDNGCKYISSDVFHDLLSGKYSEIISNVIVVDCRFEYEFAGGRIKDAINVPYDHEKELYKLFFQNVLSNSQYSAIVFHCEFSQERGPDAAKVMRRLDRKFNESSYSCSNIAGKLYYPHVYILDGGYRKYFKDYPDDCSPRGYISMFDKQYANEMNIALKRYHQGKNKKSMSRSCSFTLPSFN